MPDYYEVEKAKRELKSLRSSINSDISDAQLKGDYDRENELYRNLERVKKIQRGLE